MSRTWTEARAWRYLAERWSKSQENAEGYWYALVLRNEVSGICEALGLIEDHVGESVYGQMCFRMEKYRPNSKRVYG